jgi:hypothetical protein
LLAKPGDVTELLLSQSLLKSNSFEILANQPAHIHARKQNRLHNLSLSTIICITGSPGLSPCDDSNQILLFSVFDGNNNEMADTFEAFFAVEVRGPLGPTWYRAGYRCGETKNVICALELPASIVDPMILKDAKLTATVAPDGQIRFSLCRVGCEDISQGLPSATEPIDQLIAQFLTVDNLHLEEITSDDLTSLLQRLQRSIALVEEAMKHLSDQHVQNRR